jgi:hypothetical protein
LGLYRRHLESLDLEQLDREARASMAGPGGFPERRYGSPLQDLKSTPASVYLAGLLALTASLPSLRDIRAPALALLSRGGRYGDPELTRRRLTALSHCEPRVLEARRATGFPPNHPRKCVRPSRRGASSSLLEVYVLQRADDGTVSIVSTAASSTDQRA